jgi:hypothetical protein
MVCALRPSGLRVAALVDEVELAGNVRGELVDQGHQIEVPLDPADGAEQEAQVGEVAVDQALDLRVLDLDRHPLAVLQAGFVDLGERGRRDRLRREFVEQLGQLASQLALDGGACHAEGPGRDAVLQAGEHLHVLARQDVGARAQELAALEDQASQLDGGVVDGSRAAAVEVRPALRHVRRLQAAGDETLGLGTQVDASEGGADASGAIQAFRCRDRLRGRCVHHSFGGSDGHDQAPPSGPSSSSLSSATSSSTQGGL